MAWQVDTSHTHISFVARHMMITKVRGEFTKYDVVVNYNEDNPSLSTVEATIYTDSINTRDERRDGHLRSADFLDSAQYPAMTFKSRRVESLPNGHGRVIGDLTIRDVTREVALDVEFYGLAKSPWGTTSAGFCGLTKIDRRDWNLTWNQALETGGWLVGDQISIEIEVELVKVPDAVAETAAAD
ncbi:MAG: polyisoprenoid-binding protein [Candidatus Promineofilum sp.]|nr:polyisoprenoid-binding protein [Promineifilum sp.]